MPKHASHLDPLPDDLRPPKSSNQLIVEYLSRLEPRGIRQKTVAATLGFGPNFLSMLKKGEELPLGRILAFAAAAGLDDRERRELLHTRMLELHRCKAEICIETLVAWAMDLFEPVGDEARLLQIWREEAEPFGMSLPSVLSHPSHAARIRAAIAEAIAAEMNTLAEESADLG